jgi:integrase
VIACANPDTKDYLWVIRETMARVGEINRLTWEDVNLDVGYVILYTRKKSGGHLTPRKVPMTKKLREVLSRRYQNRDASKPWVFWHRYWSQKKGEHVEGPYDDRKKNHEEALQECEGEVFQISSHPAFRSFNHGWQQRSARRYPANPWP